MYLGIQLPSILASNAQRGTVPGGKAVAAGSRSSHSPEWMKPNGDQAHRGGGHASSVTQLLRSSLARLLLFLPSACCYVPSCFLGLVFHLNSLLSDFWPCVRSVAYLGHP